MVTAFNLRRDHDPACPDRDGRRLDQSAPATGESPTFEKRIASSKPNSVADGSGSLTPNAVALPPWPIPLVARVSNNSPPSPHPIPSCDGFLLGKQYLIHDRGTKFTDAFDRLLRDSGVEPVLSPPRSPNLNAHCERFVRSIKEEALDRMIIMGEASLLRVLREYLAHFHAERNHQGLDNQLIAPEVEVGRQAGQVARRRRLGGLLSYYHREAAITPRRTPMHASWVTRGLKKGHGGAPHVGEGHPICRKEALCHATFVL